MNCVKMRNFGCEVPGPIVMIVCVMKSVVLLFCLLGLCFGGDVPVVESVIPSFPSEDVFVFEVQNEPPSQGKKLNFFCFDKKDSVKVISLYADSATKGGVYNVFRGEFQLSKEGNITFPGALIGRPDEKKVTYACRLTKHGLALMELKGDGVIFMRKQMSPVVGTYRLEK